MAEQKLLARLKPFNEKKGYRTRTYMIDGARFYVERGWYEVPVSLGEKLKELHQDHYDEDSPALFDVATQKEAEAIDRREKQAVINAKASARRPAQVVRTRLPIGPLPTNNTGGIEALPEGGDFTTEDISSSDSEDGETGEEQKLLDPNPDGSGDDEEPNDGRIKEIGKVSTDDSADAGHRQRRKR